MAITNVQLIRDALSLINVLGVGEAAEAEQSEHALRQLNQIMEFWRTDGVDLQYYAQTVDDLGSDCPLPPDAELAVTHFLAIACAPHYGRQVSPALAALAELYYKTLTRVSEVERMQVVKNIVPRGEADQENGGISTYNILSG